MSEEIWYRMDGNRYAAPVDEFYNPVGIGRCDVHVYQLRVIRTTPKGVWVDGFGQPKFVLRDARKRFACPTESEAIASFIARKRRQWKILRAQMLTAEELIGLAQKYQKNERAA